MAEARDRAKGQLEALEAEKARVLAEEQGMSTKVAAVMRGRIAGAKKQAGLMQEQQKRILALLSARRAADALKNVKRIDHLSEEKTSLERECAAQAEELESVRSELQSAVSTLESKVDATQRRPADVLQQLAAELREEMLTRDERIAKLESAAQEAERAQREREDASRARAADLQSKMKRLLHLNSRLEAAMDAESPENQMTEEMLSAMSDKAKSMLRAVDANLVKQTGRADELELELGRSREEAAGLHDEIKRVNKVYSSKAASMESTVKRLVQLCTQLDQAVAQANPDSAGLADKFTGLSQKHRGEPCCGATRPT